MHGGSDDKLSVNIFLNFRGAEIPNMSLMLNAPAHKQTLSHSSRQPHTLYCFTVQIYITGAV